MSNFNVYKLFSVLAMRGIFNKMSDEKYLSYLYRSKLGKPLNLSNPVTFNEKLQWLKIHDRKPEYTTMVDKYAVKKYVADRIGKQYIIPTLGVWNSFDEIDFEKLPNQFVLKCTHDSGGLVICRNKSKFDKNRAKKKISKCLKKNFYYMGREWPYKNVRPRIIAEEYMEDNNTKDLRDYKFFCFNGKAKLLFIVSERQNKYEETKYDYYDANFKHLPFTNGHPNSKKAIDKPKNFELMKKLAEKLSQGIPHVRIDFYEINGIVKFGEITFFTRSGWVTFVPSEWDRKLGDLINLPNCKMR